MLVLSCEVCTSPLTLEQGTERDLLKAANIICPVCQQRSPIPNSLKAFIKKNYRVPRKVEKDGSE
jgi:uncharacterized Zn finger protein (UPF0148 family)